MKAKGEYHDVCNNTDYDLTYLLTNTNTTYYIKGLIGDISIKRRHRVQIIDSGNLSSGALQNKYLYITHHNIYLY